MVIFMGRVYGNLRERFRDVGFFLFIWLAVEVFRGIGWF